MTATGRQLDALCHLTAQSLTPLKTSDHFKIIKLLGEGSYGKVMLAVHRKRGTPMALKFFPKESTTVLSFLREYNLSLAFCSHPSLTRALGIVYSTPVHYVFAQQAGMHGDLYDIIVPEVGMAEEMVQRVVSQLSGALSHLHSLGFVHRDVKPENIFLCDQNCHWVKLGDFGLTKPKGARIPAVWYESPYCIPEVEMMKEKKAKRRFTGKKMLGKSAKGIVVAGSILNRWGKVGEGQKDKISWMTAEVAIDTWALGILIYSMLTGSYPWRETSSDDPGYVKYKEWLESDKGRQRERGEEIQSKGHDLGKSAWSNEGVSLDCGPVPPQFAVFTTLACSLFQGLLDPEPSLRTLPEDVLRYLGGTWLLTKGEVEKHLSEKGTEIEKEKGGRT